jgi:hypothetical protein
MPAAAGFVRISNPPQRALACVLRHDKAGREGFKPDPNGLRSTPRACDARTTIGRPMPLDETLTALEAAGYRDVSFIAMPNGPQYLHRRTSESVWVCQTESYAGDPSPLYAWGTPREEAAARLLQLVLSLHPE